MKTSKPITKIITTTTFFIILLILFFGCWFSIPAGHRGILLTFGKPTETPYDEGFHLKIPLIQKAVKLSVQTQKYPADASSASKDLQIVSTQIVVNFHVVPEQTVTLYRELGINYADRIIQPMVQEVVKASTAQFTAEELITKRPEVKEKIDSMLKERLRPRGIIVEDTSITNFDFSVSFNQAIEAKVTAEQLKLKADRDLERVRVEAEQKIASAQAEAESLRMQKQEITPDLIKLRSIEVERLAVEKWDGVLPTTTCGGAVPFLNLQASNGG